MALWKHDETHETFDDGQRLKPGEEGFARDQAETHFGDKSFSYMGTPNWRPSEQPQGDEA